MSATSPKQPRTRRVLAGQPVHADVAINTRLQEGDFICMPLGTSAANDRYDFSQDGRSEWNVPMLLAAVVMLAAFVVLLVVAGMVVYRLAPRVAHFLAHLPPQVAYGAAAGLFVLLVTLVVYRKLAGRGAA